MGYSKVWWGVVCNKHGSLEKGSGNTKWAKASPPKGKKDRKGRGCVMCKAASGVV